MLPQDPRIRGVRIHGLQGCALIGNTAVYPKSSYQVSHEVLFMNPAVCLFRRRGHMFRGLSEQALLSPANMQPSRFNEEIRH